jgi:LemA protein
MWFGIIGAIVLVVLWAISKYNSFIVLRNRIENAWAQINVELKRRYDLIPNLIEAVKGYMKYEKEVLESVTNARAAAMQAKTPAESGPAEDKLTQAVHNIFAVMENYPDLKANENVLRLQEELTTTENKIAFSRQFYNDIVMRFNQSIQTFPSSFIANLFGFKAREYFEVDQAQVKDAPKVDLTI